MVLFLILTALTACLLFVIIYHLTYRYQLILSLREIFLLVMMALGLIIALSTEGLSLFTSLTSEAIKSTWLTVFVTSVGWVIYLVIHRKESLHALGEEIRKSFNKLKVQPWQAYLILSFIAIIFIATLITIKLNPVPTNGDSMRYHLTRTLVWEQQASVRHYATHTLHQISLPPFAEYTLLHVNILVGNDHLSRIVQWIAMLICVVGVSEIAKRLGADSRQQIITALLCITIPMVIAQSTSTMNDLVVAAWLTCFINFGLRFKRDPRNLLNAAVTGLALGLALLAKSTAFIFALPFSIWVAISIFRTQGFRRQVWKAGSVIIMMILLINAGQFTRNVITFGQPLGDDAGGTVNEIFSLRVLASNVIRNIQMHMPDSKKGNPKALNWLAEEIKKTAWTLHELTGMDPEDPRTTFKGKYVGFEDPGGFNTAEDRAGGFVLLIMILFTIFFGLVRTKNQDQNQYILVLITTFLLFSFLLKAQSPMNRLVMPYQVMWTPVIGSILFRYNRRGWIIFPVLVFLFSLPWLLETKSRPLIPNQKQHASSGPTEGTAAYFVRKSELLHVFKEATSVITDRQCPEIGIVYYGNTYFFEYPFWMMLREKGWTGVIQHIMVTNESGIYEDSQYSPCIIISNTELEHLASYTLLETIDDYLIYTEK